MNTKRDARKRIQKLVEEVLQDQIPFETAIQTVQQEEIPYFHRLMKRGGTLLFAGLGDGAHRRHLEFALFKNEELGKNLVPPRRSFEKQGFGQTQMEIPIV